MIFASKSAYDYTYYKIDLQGGISPIYHLLVELFNGKGTAETFHEWIGSLFDLKKIANINSLREGETEDSFLKYICSYLCEDMCSQLNFFTHTAVHYINTSSEYLIYKADSKVGALLANWIKKYSPIDKLFSLIIDDTVRSYKGKLCKCISEDIWQTSVRVEKGKKYEATIIPFEWIDQEDLVLKEADCGLIYAEKNVWDFTSVNPNEASLYELFYENMVVGVKFGNHVMPYVNMDNYIKEEFYQDYFWKMLVDVYSKPCATTICKQGKDLLDCGKTVEFSRVLSYLKYNLYISEPNVIPNDRIHMFENIYNFSNLEHLENYELYTAIPEENSSQTILGVYELKRVTGDSNYNLLHWHNASNGEVHFINGDKDPQLKTISKVYALKPKYAYYYISKYFEDLMACVLKEINAVTINNVRLYGPSKGDGPLIEFDHIVRKKDGSFLYIEDKTTLNSNNVAETLKKIVKFKRELNKLNKEINFEYIIIAPYGNSTLDDSYLFFIKNNGTSGIRQGFATKVYDFNLPIPQFDDVSLRCIVEPEYEKIKEVISKIVG